MDLLRRESDYALRCLAHLARRGTGYLGSVHRIAIEEKIPEPLLRKTLGKLKRAGVVKSVRGSLGGFRISLPPEKTTVLKVVEAVQGPMRISRCFVAKDWCPCQPKCRLRPKLMRVQEGLEKLLYDMTTRRRPAAQDRFR